MFMLLFFGVFVYIVMNAENGEWDHNDNHYQYRV